jgi:hypothetical protein
MHSVGGRFISQTFTELVVNICTYSAGGICGGIVDIGDQYKNSAEPPLTFTILRDHMLVSEMYWQMA